MILTKFNLWGNNLRQQLKIIWLQDKILLILFLVSLILNLLLYLAILGWVRAQTEPLILHYSVYFGIDLIGSWYRLYLMPAVGSFLLLVNFFLTILFYRKERIIGYFSSGALAFAELLLLVGGILLVWINH
jgi:hypothetical protein